MSITLDIARTGMALSEYKVQQAVDISMIKKSMEVQEQQMESLLSQISGVVPSVGSKIDTRA